MIPSMQGIISWPYWVSQILIAGPGIGLAIITSLAKIVLTLLRSFEHPDPGSQISRISDCQNPRIPIS